MPGDLAQFWNEHGIAAKVDRQATSLQQIGDLRDAVLARCGGDGDGTKGCGFPDLHADHVAKAYLTRRLFSSTYDCDGYLFVRVRLEGFHVVVIVVVMTDGDTIQSRQ